MTVNAKKREKRTLNSVLRYFGYRVIPLTNTESVSEKYENSPEVNPRILRLRTILPSRLEVEWTTVRTANINEQRKSEKIKSTEPPISTVQQTTTKSIEDTTIQQTTESTTEFLIRLPDVEEQVDIQSENSTDKVNMMNTEKSNSTGVNIISIDGGFAPALSNSDLNFELIKSNDVYLGSTMHVDDYNYNSYQYVMPHFESMQEINGNQISAEQNEIINFNNYFRQFNSGV